MQWKALVRVPGAQTRQSVHRDCAVVALVLACLGEPAAAGPVGPAETFEGDPVGSFPAGWSDAARLDPASTAPNPSAVVVSTTDAFGKPTKALATLPKTLGTLPATGPTQGIYRAISPSGFYSTNADVRIDRFSDFSNFDCGCPPAALAATDFTMQAGFAELQGTTDFSEIPTLAVYASAKTQGWRLLAFTANVVADFDLGVPVTLGKWYGLKVDLNAIAATVHSRITDVATGSTLADLVTSLPASWNPAVDGRFDVENFVGGELTALTTSGLATVDNIDTPIPEPATMLLLASALAACAAARRWK